MRLSREVQELLRCPMCRERLQEHNGELLCGGQGCGRVFPLTGDIPVLINEANSVFTISHFLNHRPTFFKPVGRLRASISNCLPTLSHNIAAVRILRRMRDELLRRNAGARVLVVGGGIRGAGIDALVSEPRIEVVETDASLGRQTQLICDGHDLPFADGSFDGLIIQAVLEHVVDPTRCVEEIHRVLKEDGLVYADTPFICQVHGREYDFTRYTRLGHRRLFRRFGELSAGMTSGPGMALGWTARYFLLSFFRSRLMRSIVSAASRLAFFWLKYFDYLLQHRPGATDAAFAFYFLGQKQQQPLSDRQLLESYRGGF